jgi:hypothetical protein
MVLSGTSNISAKMSLVVGISHLVYKYIFIYAGSIVFTFGSRGRRSHDRLLVWFTTAYVITNNANGDMYLIQHYVIKFVSAVWQFCDAKLLK